MSSAVRLSKREYLDKAQSVLITIKRRITTAPGNWQADNVALLCDAVDSLARALEVDFDDRYYPDG